MHVFFKSTGYSLSVVLFCTFVVFSTFYAPQPLLPHLSKQFSVSPTSAALLITVTFAALCVAPLFYGALLQYISARTLMIIATILLAVTQWWFSATNSFNGLLLSRSVQALLYPALFTAAVTYCSQAGPDKKIASRVSMYIAMTITGGLFGRLASGFISSSYHWSVVFQIAALTLLVCSFLLATIISDTPKGGITKSNTIVKKVLQNPTFLSGYCLIFTTFFAFSATLNALPFRLVDIEPEISPARISLVYAGYIIGIFIASNTDRLENLFGGRIRAMTAALAVFICGLALHLVAITWWLAAVSFLTAAGMFLIHATLSGFLTSLRPRHSSVINGLYITIYYAAGALGSVLPLWIYKTSGWSIFLMTITLVASTGFISLKRLSLESHRHLDRTQPR